MRSEEMEERMRREEMHAHLGICPVLSKEAALDIGVGSIGLAIDFCLIEETRERVRKEAQKVVQKTGLRSQGAEAASLRGLSAPAPADLVGNATMGRRSSMALVPLLPPKLPRDPPPRPGRRSRRSRRSRRGTAPPRRAVSDLAVSGPA